jgi:hypothetical protein
MHVRADRRFRAQADAPCLHADGECPEGRLTLGGT